MKTEKEVLSIARLMKQTPLFLKTNDDILLREALIVRLTAEMKAAAKILEFEHAAYLRDRIEKLRKGK